MRVVFVTDMWAAVIYDLRCYAYLPAYVALLRPNWDIAVYWRFAPPPEEGSDPVNSLISENGGAAKVQNYYGNYEQIWDDRGDVLILMGGVPSHDPKYNDILLNLSTLRGRFSQIIYYCLDNWEGWHGSLYLSDENNRMFKIRDAEQFVLSNSDFALAVSPQLCKYLCARYNYTRPVFWLPNGGRILEGMQTTPYVGETLVAVYVGVWLPHRFTGWKETLREVAARFPHIHFYIIGSKFGVDQKDVINSYYGNLYFISRLPLLPHGGVKDNLATFLRNASFGLVLAGRNVFSYYADPTKWYLYHSFGLPVLSLNTPHHTMFPNFYINTVCAADLAEGLEKIERMLRDGKFNSGVLKEHDWSHRAAALISIIERGEAIYGKVEAGKWESRW